jgi:hypothetical protein
VDKLTFSISDNEEGKCCDDEGIDITDVADEIMELALAMLLLLILYFAGGFEALFFNEWVTAGGTNAKSSRSAPLDSESGVFARFTGRLAK